MQRSTTQPVVLEAYEAQTGTPLHRHGTEYKGPCPKCGGTDRFYVRRDGYFGCRKCGQGRDSFKALARSLGLWTDRVAKMRRGMSDREFSDFRRMAALERHYPGAGNRMGLAEYLDRVAVTIVLYGRGFRQVAIAGVTRVTQGRISQMVNDPKLAHLTELPDAPTVDDLALLVPLLTSRGSRFHLLHMSYFLGGFGLVSQDAGQLEIVEDHPGRRKRRKRRRSPPSPRLRRTDPRGADAQINALLDVFGDRDWFVS